MTLHILQGGIDNGDRDWLIKAARHNLSTKTRWIAPKSARAGDHAVIYIGGAFFATATIATDASLRPSWGPRAYGSGLKSVRLIMPPIDLGTIRRIVPALTWAIYPRSITTPSPEVAAQIRKLIARGKGSFEIERPDAAGDIAEILRDPRIRKTTRIALVNARLGQGGFRDDLLRRWKGACAVTGCRVGGVLRASHIKPWKRSTNRERLDPANGLLLTANIDALFDAGLVTFDENGKMIVSASIGKDERKRLGLPRNLVRAPDRSERAYMSEHRRSFVG
jgi:hypothetical protein